MNKIENKKAYFDYSIEEKFEAGIVLLGWEIKAIREGKAQIKESHIVIRKEELFMIQAHITPLATVPSYVKPDPTRDRKLLMHKKEISKLIGKVERQGYTLIPLNFHFSKGNVKVDVGLAKGKKQYEKRDIQAKRDWNLTRSRLLKQRTRR